MLTVPPHSHSPSPTVPCPPCPSSFRLGRQEDAHEYLRCLVDAMHEAWLKVSVRHATFWLSDHG